MAQPESAITIKQWMEQFAEAIIDGRVQEISAGAGPTCGFAYMHFRTEDGAHSALVLRAVRIDGRAAVRVVPVTGDVDHIRDLVDAATHGDVVP